MRGRQLAATGGILLALLMFRFSDVQLSETLPQTITNSIEMKFVLIPAGEFMMGSEEGTDAEKPVHLVRISKPFYMGVYEVTQAQWDSVIGWDHSSGFKGPDRPVEFISYFDAQIFIRDLNRREQVKSYRLPTEAEWEYACRAGTTTPFSFGATITPSQVNYDGQYPFEEDAPPGKSRYKTLPVGSFPPNAWGLYDMHGNVAEWVRDWHEIEYYKDSPGVDPPGPAKGKFKVVRGGSWYDPAWNARSSDRNSREAGKRHKYLGFRLVKMIE